MPFHFTPAQRAALSTRLIVQPPTTQAQVERHADIARQRRRIEGLPIDVLEALEALRLLAEQGNKVAEMLYMDEREKLGIDRPRHFGA